MSRFKLASEKLYSRLQTSHPHTTV